MGDIKLPVPGIEFLQEVQTTQIAIINSTNAMTLTFANNICTLTFASAHGITNAFTAGTGSTPSTLPNYYFNFGGSAFTGVTGTGTLTGPIFRILTIPSATTLTFYTTVTAATTAAGTQFQPVFLLPNIPLPASGPYTGGPTLSGTAQPPPWAYACTANLLTGANCTVQYAPGNWAGSTVTPSIVYDSTSGPPYVTASTPTTAPTYRTLVPVSTAAQLSLMGTGVAFIVSSTTNAGTTYASVVE